MQHVPNHFLSMASNHITQVSPSVVLEAVVAQGVAVVVPGEVPREAPRSLWSLIATRVSLLLTARKIIS